MKMVLTGITTCVLLLGGMLIVPALGQKVSTVSNEISLDSHKSGGSSSSGKARVTKIHFLGESDFGPLYDGRYCNFSNGCGGKEIRLGKEVTLSVKFRLDGAYTNDPNVKVSLCINLPSGWDLSWFSSKCHTKEVKIGDKEVVEWKFTPKSNGNSRVSFNAGAGGANNNFSFIIHVKP